MRREFIAENLSIWEMLTMAYYYYYDGAFSFSSLRFQVPGIDKDAVIPG